MPKKSGELTSRREGAILDRDDDRLSGIERGAYLARVRVAQLGACRAARNEPAIMGAGEAERARSKS